MLTSMLLGAALAAPGAPVPSSADRAPSGPAPWVLYLKAAENQRPQLMLFKTQKVTQSRAVSEIVDGKPVQKIVQEQVERVMTSYVLLDTINPTLTTASGSKVTMDSLMKRAKTGVVLLISADGKPVSKSWLRTVDPEAIVAVSDSLVSEAAPRSTLSGQTTAPPRLALLNTDMKGDVILPVNPNATTNNGAYYGRGRVMMANGQQMFFDDAVGSYSPYQTPTTGEAPLKPLKDVKFEAYDLTGKSVSEADALKRLSAGGYVLIAGDNRIPDESYLKQFRGDLLVLISNELINVPNGKKKADGAAPVVRPAPAIKLGVIQAAPALRVAPALKVVPAPAPALPAQKEDAPVPAPAKAVPAKAAPAPVIEKEVPARPLPARVEQ